MNEIQEIVRIREKVEMLGLSGSERVLIMPIDELSSVYNGTGPEFLPQAIREKLDDICYPFLPAVMVHDVDFSCSDGSVNDFNAANNRLLENCIVCAYDAFPWYHWRRYALISEAYAIHRACVKFGWIAWIQSSKKSK